MNFEDRLNDALSAVYGAMGRDGIEDTIKDIAGQLSIAHMESINVGLEQHFESSISFKPLQK